MRSDTVLANKILNELAPLSTFKKKQELMIIVAKRLLDTPYFAGTLEGGEKEELRVFLHKTDCILFVETCLNLAQASKEYGRGADFLSFANLVRESRYRNGVVENYSDRIHYTTEWIRQNEGRGLIKDITEELGGVEYNHPIFFMTKNFERYEQLKQKLLYERLLADCIKSGVDTSGVVLEGQKSYQNYKKIKEVEEQLNAKPFYYIPQEDIPSIEHKIKSGDIICFMSGVEGLDIAHVALAYVQRGKVGFIHASMGAMKVVIDSKSIYEYVKSSKSITGIKVVRPL